MRWPLLLGALLAILLPGPGDSSYRQTWPSRWTMPGFHQSYARTVAAQPGEWALPAGPAKQRQHGPPVDAAAGAGAPAAPVARAVGHSARAARLGGDGGLGGALAWQLFKDRTIALWGMAALAAEWHLMWAALSGMEITLFARSRWGCLPDPGRPPALAVGAAGGAADAHAPGRAVVGGAAGRVSRASTSMRRGHAHCGPWRRGGRGWPS